MNWSGAYTKVKMDKSCMPELMVVISIIVKTTKNEANKNNSGLVKNKTQQANQKEATN